MTDSSTARLPPLKEVVTIACAIISLLVVVRGVLLADGGREKQLDENTRRIEKLEAADTAKTDLLRTIDGRTIRIETKLELIVPAKGGVQP